MVKQEKLNDAFARFEHRRVGDIFDYHAILNTGYT
jgi:hypothetical protein